MAGEGGMEWQVRVGGSLRMKFSSDFLCRVYF